MIENYKIKLLSKFIIIWLSLFISIGCLNISIIYAAEVKPAFTFNSASPYWPTEEWKISIPEEQGMDSEILAEMFNEMNKFAFDHRIYSLLIIRNGYIVVEAYYPGYSKDSLFKIYSSTKSITSALFGIAMNTSHISSLDKHALDFFRELKLNDIERKKKITLRHLLTMTSGLEWPELETRYTNLNNPVRRMQASEDWAQYVLERPMTEKPGSVFNYNSGCSYLLGKILHKKIGDSLAFAEDNLFDPLGISNCYWSQDMNGVINGSHGLEMRTRDMAKFGYLYLKGGNWGGQQIVPREWVEESTTGHIKKYGKPPEIKSPYYGYQWYIDPPYFHSLGYQGQYIFVIPEHEMVVVFTSRLSHHQYFFVPRLLERFIVLSAKTKNPRPVNHKSKSLLESKIKKFKTGWWEK
ncbi:serine hydrolase domain-containing protein [Thermodesulfobacteriota bacterium]